MLPAVVLKFWVLPHFVLNVSLMILTYGCHCFLKQNFDTDCIPCKEGTEVFTVMYINMLERHCWQVCVLSELW